jgi:DNA mismatch repair protein MutS2
VELADQGIRGELLSVDGERAWIQRGSLRFEVPAAQLGRVSKKEIAAPVRVNLTSDVESARNEISLIGLRARQALAELEQFLDRAAQARLTRVRIVHGFGSGALRRAVQDYLSSSPYCSEFRNGSGDEGGGAVTVVELNV